MSVAIVLVVTLMPPIVGGRFEEHCPKKLSRCREPCSRCWDAAGGMVESLLLLGLSREGFGVDVCSGFKQANLAGLKIV
eukprot:6424419-Amphidinium_carterae.1